VWSWRQFKEYPRVFIEELSLTEKTSEKPVSGPRFEIGTSEKGILDNRLQCAALNVKLLKLRTDPHLVPKISMIVCIPPTPYAFMKYIETTLPYLLECTPKSLAKVITWNVTFAVLILPTV
jgi:hypothetical protein